MTNNTFTFKDNGGGVFKMVIYYPPPTSFLVWDVGNFVRDIDHARWV